MPKNKNLSRFKPSFLNTPVKSLNLLSAYKIVFFKDQIVLDKTELVADSCGW